MLGLAQHSWFIEKAAETEKSAAMLASFDLLTANSTTLIVMAGLQQECCCT
jgi:hypothetical protein